jgi:wobble nucleotide-excising tRNase
MNDGSKCTYNSGTQNENIEIFDNEFIHKNVFAGDLIDKNNKSSLYNILLDDQNIKLKEEIDNLEKKQDTITTEKSNAKIAIKDFSNFIKLEPVDEIKDINKKVEENNNKATQFTNQGKLDDLCKKSKFNFNFADFEEKLKQTIDTKLESKINEHIKSNHKGSFKNKDFLKSGTDLINESENCPFCGQSLKDVSDHITVLKTFFSDAYKEVQKSINDSIESFNQIDVEKEVNAFKVCGLEFSKLDLVSLEVIFSKVKDRIKEKQTDLSKDINIDKDTDYVSFKEEILNLKKEIDKITAKSLDIETLNKETYKLLLNRDRFSADGIAKFNAYKEKEREFEENKKVISEKTDKLKLDLNSLFQNHLEKINEVLTVSGANFKLKKLDANTNRSLRDHMCEYSFVFDDTFDVNLDGGNDIPTFKNTLSDSDKRVLAFAFFIAKIKSENNIQTKIVVLDDPFTSLDEDRKDSMINLIKDLGFEQVIILSHSKRFVGRCFDLLPNDKMKTLKLHSSIANGSLFEIMDVKKEILDSDIEKDLSYIRESIKYNKTLKEACQKVRPCIEQILKEKYLDFIKPESLSGNSSISTFLTDIGDKCPAKKDIENGYWHDDHHTQNPINTADDTERLNKLKYFIETILPTI